MRANYGEPLRKWLKNQPIKQIIDFGDLRVFQGATTYPCIFIAGKEKMDQVIKVTNVKTLEFTNLDDYIQENSVTIKNSSLDDRGWNLGSETEQQLLKKLQDAGIPLGEYVKGKIYRGVLTGLNEAFVIDEATKNRLIAEDKRSEEIIKPFLAGRDIKRYQPPSSKSFLIFFPKGFTNKNGNNPKNAWKWLIENYSAIALYLKRFEEKGKKRFDQGEYWWELRACDYYDEFEKEKIIVPAIVQGASYTWDLEKIYSNDKTSIISTKDKYLLGLLNSKATDYFMKSIASTKQGGYYEYKPMYVSKLPIAKAEKSAHDEIVHLVETMLQLNKEKHQTNTPDKLEQLKARIQYTDDKINKLVYRLYRLSEEEVGIVEGV